MSQLILALSTCPDDAVARRIADALVSERLAACVNRVPGVQSTYFWDGVLKEDAEVLLIIKTTADCALRLEARLRELHPYEVPEVLLLEVTGGNERYLDWVRSGVRATE